MSAIPCVLCREPLPAQLGGAYLDASPVGLLARIYCCPACIERHGAKSAFVRARSLLESVRPVEVSP
jgi:hypothetical protein